MNKILIGNKSDWTDKKAVTEEQGRELANELGIRFMETSAKVNEGVEEAFFTLARSGDRDSSSIVFDAVLITIHVCRDIKTRLIDSQADAAGASAGGSGDGSVKVNQPSASAAPGCCS